MDVENWQAARICNSRYLQNGPVKPWPWGIQVQILGSQGSGRKTLLKRENVGDHLGISDYACKQMRFRNLPCGVWFDVPTSLTSFGDQISKQALFATTARGLRDCDALILVYDLTNEKSFQALCKFCRRCEMEGIAVAPGKSLPCLIVGTKCDRPNQVHVEDGYKLAKKLGTIFIQVSSRTGEGCYGLIEEAVNPVIDARVQLMHESEATLGESVRALMAWMERRRLKKRREIDHRRPTSKALCNGAPPRWTMRDLPSLPRWNSFDRLSDSSSEAVVPCPPEFQLSVDLVEPAATDWAPKF